MSVIIRPDAEAPAILGPYKICRAVERKSGGGKGEQAFAVLKDKWALPGGKDKYDKSNIVGRDVLQAIADRNGWTLYIK